MRVNWISGVRTTLIRCEWNKFISPIVSPTKKAVTFHRLSRGMQQSPRKQKQFTLSALSVHLADVLQHPATRQEISRQSDRPDRTETRCSPRLAVDSSRIRERMPLCQLQKVNGSWMGLFLRNRIDDVLPPHAAKTGCVAHESVASLISLLADMTASRRVRGESTTRAPRAPFGVPDGAASKEIR